MTYRDGLTVLITAEALRQRVQELGQQITREYAGSSLVLVCVLKGSFIFAADLARAIELPLEIEFLGVRSYENTESSGIVEVTQDLRRSVEGGHVLIVEDIVDTGLTSAFLLDLLKARRPASLRLCTLLHKPARRKVEVPLDYVGFTIEDRYVVGYGLDANQRFRHLPDVCIYGAE